MAKEKETKKITLRDRKKAQPKAVLYFSEKEKQVIKETIAKDLTQEQFTIFVYTAQALGLNPLINEICAIPYKVKTGGTKLSIQVMRDGFLTIAHRSGKFAGLESGVYEPDEKRKTMVGWAKVYAKGFEVPVYQEADFNEYQNDRNPLWASKPRTMIKKVAESMALRKAFNVNGVYAPEEMEKEISLESVAPKVLELAGGDSPATPEQIATIQSLDPEYSEEEAKKLTKQQAAETIRRLSGKKE